MPQHGGRLSQSSEERSRTCTHSCPSVILCSGFGGRYSAVDRVVLWCVLLGGAGRRARRGRTARTAGLRPAPVSVRMPMCVLAFNRVSLFLWVGDVARECIHTLHWILLPINKFLLWTCECWLLATVLTVVQSKQRRDQCCISGQFYWIYLEPYSEWFSLTI